jgi:hypothetical protein
LYSTQPILSNMEEPNQTSVQGKLKTSPSYSSSQLSLQKRESEERSETSANSVKGPIIASSSYIPQRQQRSIQTWAQIAAIMESEELNLPLVRNTSLDTIMIDLASLPKEE